MNNCIQITGISNTESYPKCAPNVPSQQICESDKLYIPLRKPTMESILHVYVNISVCSFDIICTPAGRKLIIEGMKHIKVIYVADEPCQSVHSAHFDIPFCMFVLLKGLNCEVWNAFAAIEDVKVRQLSSRCFWISTVIFACPDTDKASVCCRNDGCSSNVCCDECGFIECDDCGYKDEQNNCGCSDEGDNYGCGNEYEVFNYSNDSGDCGNEDNYLDCSNELLNCDCKNECDNCDKTVECSDGRLRNEYDNYNIKDEFNFDVKKNKLSGRKRKNNRDNVKIEDENSRCGTKDKRRGVRNRKDKYGSRKNKNKDVCESKDEPVFFKNTYELPEENLTDDHNDSEECVISNECKYCLNKRFCKKWKKAFLADVLLKNQGF